MATWTTPFLATLQPYELASCRSGELAVRWMVATYLSTCARPGLKDECSARFVTSWSFADHCVHGKTLPHLSLFRKVALNARRMKRQHAEAPGWKRSPSLAKSGTRALRRGSLCCQIGVCHFSKPRLMDARIIAGSRPVNRSGQLDPDVFSGRFFSRVVHRKLARIPCRGRRDWKG